MDILSLKRIRRRVFDTIQYLRVLSNWDNSYDRTYQVTIVSSDNTQDLLAAKRLHAQVHLRRGFVSNEDVRDGIIHRKSDPYQDHSLYFVVKKDNEVVGALREIYYKGSGDPSQSFPVLKKGLIYKRSRKSIDRVDPSKIIEISALVKKPGESAVIPLLLYRALWWHCVRHDITLCVMACDPRLFQRLRILFGTNLRKIGRMSPYKGADAQPAALSLAGSRRELERLASKHEHRRTVRRQAAAFILREGKYE